MKSFHRIESDSELKTFSKCRILSTEKFNRTRLPKFKNKLKVENVSSFKSTRNYTWNPNRIKRTDSMKITDY